MYPIYRLVSGLIKAKRSSKLTFNDSSVIHFYCRPWDIDMFQELNNGRALTLFDLGRFDLATRTPLMKLLKANNWGLVVAGSTVRYRKRIRMFDKIEMHTKMIGFDDRWVYLSQSMWVKGEPCSSALLRTGITSKGKVINPQESQKMMGIENLELERSEWLERWTDSELARPWPPEI